MTAVKAQGMKSKVSCNQNAPSGLLGQTGHKFARFVLFLPNPLHNNIRLAISQQPFL